VALAGIHAHQAFVRQVEGRPEVRHVAKDQFLDGALDGRAIATFWSLWTNRCRRSVVFVDADVVLAERH